jgi:GAF domain-containing protein
MSESLTLNPLQTKQEKYKSLLLQISALISGETDLTANLANIASALYFGMDFFWLKMKN